MMFRFKNNSLDVSMRTYIMGILNVTDDSFSDGGNYNTVDAAIRRVETMLDDGVDIIDVGGESTKPGYMQISAEQEIENVVPIISEIKKRYNVPVSVDTYKYQVAEKAIEAGADIVNDIWGLQYDNQMASVCARSDVGVIAMANKSETMVGGICQRVSDTYKRSIEIARLAGIKDDHIVLDPGFGFGKSYEENLELLNNLDTVDTFGFPTLVGISRKSMIGHTLDTPPNERLEGTIACNTIAIMKGANIIRVHDVKQGKLAAKMVDKIRRS